MINIFNNHKNNMKNEKLNKSTSPSDDQDNSSDVQPLAPNPKLPWCPKCKRHSDYHLKVVTVHDSDILVAFAKKLQACTPATNVVGTRGNRNLLYFLISSV